MSKDYHATSRSCMMFDACISNPPYQGLVVSKGDLDKNGKSVSRDHFRPIFVNFQTLGSSISKKSCMIYPSSWQSSFPHESSAGGTLLRCGLKIAETYNGSTIFGSAIMTGYPVSIVCTHFMYKDNIRVDDDTWLYRDSKSWRGNPWSIALEHYMKQYMRDNNLSCIPKVSSPLNIGSVEEILELAPDFCFYETSQEAMNEIFHTHHEHSPENSSSINTSAFDFDTPVCLTIKKKRGVVADTANFWCSKESLLQQKFSKSSARSMMDSWSVSMKSALFKQNRLFEVMLSNPKQTVDASVFPPQHGHGKTWMFMSSFDTEEEAENFCQYINSRCMTLALTLERTMTSFGSLVPMLSDYTSSNPLFMSDDQLRKASENNSQNILQYLNKSLDERLLLNFGINDNDKKIFQKLMYGF